MKKKNLFKTTIAAFILLISFNSFSQKNIVETAAASKDFTTLVAAVRAADLVDVLSSEGPFTVFAPVNDAFAKLPDGTVESLLKPENKSKLQAVLTYHVVQGNVMASDVVALIKKSDGKASIKTVNGEMLTAQMKDGAVYLVDKNNNWSKVTATDLKQTNGVIHVIDTVVLP